MEVVEVVYVENRWGYSPITEQDEVYDVVHLRRTDAIRMCGLAAVEAAEAEWLAGDWLVRQNHVVIGERADNVKATIAVTRRGSSRYYFDLAQMCEVDTLNEPLLVEVDVR